MNNRLPARYPRLSSILPACRLGPALQQAALLLFGAGLAPPCLAQYGLSLETGTRDHINSLGLQLALPRIVDRLSSSLRITAYPEIQLSRYEYHGDQLIQAGGFAIGRLTRSEGALRPYLEVGLGINMLSRDNIGDRTLSTRFQFGEILGLGIAWGGAGEERGRGESWLSARFVHFSNAGLKNPNDGLDNVQLVLGHRF